MGENVKTKNSKLLKYLIGILLLMPFYMAVFAIMYNLNLDYDGYELYPIVMYVPAIIGVVLIHIFCKEKASLGLDIGLLVLAIVSVFCWCMAYFVEWEAWGGIGYILNWIVSSVAFRICGAVYCGKIVGWKKGLILFGVYIFVIVLSLLLGFWA